MRPSHWLWLALMATLMLLATVIGACGGGDDGGDSTPVPGGSLTDPRTIPTATPWPEPPEPILLEEGAIAPLSGEGEETPSPAGGQIYTVQAGDTAFDIAQRFNITLEELARANNTTIDDLRNLSIGQELIIPEPSQ